MLYQLPTGKVIEISTEQYLEMSDEELEYLIAYNYGEVMEDPWFGSVLSKRDSSTPDKPDTYEDLIDIPEEDKLTDLDIDTSLTEE
jgi:hypothetical protein